MTRTKKRLIAIIVSVAVVLTSLATFLIVRTVINRRPPKLENIRARVETLIELSGDLNQILWGEGLPVYERVPRTNGSATVTNRPGGRADYSIGYYTFPDATYGTVIAYQYWSFEDNVYYDLEAEAAGDPITLKAENVNKNRYRFAYASAEQKQGYIWHNAETGTYYYPLADFTAPYPYSASDDPDYEYVKESSGYLSIADIRDEVKLVFSAAIVAEIEQAVFTGVTVFEGDDGTSYPRYRDIEGKDGSFRLGMTQKDAWNDFTLTEWVYDFDTLQMAKPSNAKSVTLSLECYPEGNESAREVREIKFVLENGEWYLDSYTR